MDSAISDTGTKFITHSLNEYLGGNMKKVYGKHNQEGFTLIEVVMGMVILGIGIFSIAALQTRNMNLNTSSKKQTEGYTWAMDHVEQLLVAPYDTDPLIAVGGPTTVVQGPYNVVWSVLDNTANIPNSRLVNVAINWNNRQVAALNFTRTRVSF